MEVRITHKTERIGGREYPVTITRQVGLQEIDVDGELVTVGEVVIFDSPLGRSRCFTRAAEGVRIGPEAAARAREIAAQAMLEQGLW